MRLHNSLTSKVEDITPLRESSISIYSCGPTVYNNLHIGNLSAFIYADVLRRALTVEGYTVRHVMNITDVDDKTIRDSKKEFPEDEPMKALKKLTDKYTKVFKSDLAATGNSLDKITFISAVDSIDEMIVLIQKILDAGIAYKAEDGIYFSIKKYIESGFSYGILQKVDARQSQARVANDEYDKDSASDFALWKKSEPGEPSWNAFFTIDDESLELDGRPGWHIECSAMSEKLLGVPFDIHTGGVDLKFPHHENEIAQSCAAGADLLATYFVHNNHILVDGKKMSKSLGNFYTLRDIEEKGFNAQDFRMLVLESHYQSESNFSWDILTAAKNRRRNWQHLIDLQHQLPIAEDTSVIEVIKDSLSSNIDSPKVLSIVDSYFDSCEKAGNGPHQAVIQLLEDALGLTFDSEDIPAEIALLLKDRSEARASSNWAASDNLRDTLLTHGIAVNDSASGQIWSRS